MTSDRPADYLASLLHELCTWPRETEWVEFKVNGVDPQGIGEYISALANSAALVGKAFAYLIWGVRDDDHAVVGTSFDPHAARVGNEELESWLLRLLEPKLDFRLQVELFQLPAPLFESPEGFTRAVLFAHKPLSSMDKADRVRACYLHACLSYVTRKEMTNTTLRTRFGVEEKNRSTVSRLIREAVEAGAIVPADPDSAPKLMRYLPFWAAALAGGRR